MQFQASLLVSLIFGLSSISASPSPEPSPTPQQYLPKPSSSPEPPRAGYYPPSSSQRPVYTAQRSRDPPRHSISSEDDDEPYPSTSSLGTAQTTHGAEETENTGFVEPIDFKNLLQEVESSSNKGLELGASASNPLFASESKNSFSGFFDSQNKDPFADFGGSGLATASSERNTKNQDGQSTGFVDPNVNFRSLFDSSQTASNGFRPRDFLGSQGDASQTEPSKGSQTRTFPSYTYTGRRDNDDDDQPTRFRSSYRNVDSQDDDDNENRNRRGRDDDRDYEDSPPQRGTRGGGGYSSSPRYNNNNNQGPRHSPHTEESSNRPQSAGRASPKAAESKNNPKCKKVEKTVDYQNEDYQSFNEPEPDYDPSTYRGRYKRQSRARKGRQTRNKRPMTCYVCEDEHGRYAERCQYDSNKNPNKNEYFHSSSSSFSDNGNNKGRRQSG